LDEASKRRRVGLAAKTTGPANVRARSVLTTINAGAHPDNMSDVASTTESVIEFTCKEDVEKLLAEKLRAKKNDFRVLIFFFEFFFPKLGSLINRISKY
jgi:hypothetical protein